MMKEARQYHAKVILDIGCGKGELLGMVRKVFASSECVGVDIGDWVYLTKKETRSSSLSNVDIVRADCRFLPFRSGCTQLVFCASVLEHLFDPQLRHSRIS